MIDPIVLKKPEELAAQIQRFVQHQIAVLEEAGINSAEPTSNHNVVLHLLMEQLLEAWNAGKLSPLEVCWLVQNDFRFGFDSDWGPRSPLLDPGRGDIFVPPTLK